MKILYHIVSGMTMPVYIADQTVQPDKNVYLYTRDSKKYLEQIKSVIKRDYCEILVDPYDQVLIQEELEADMLKYKDDELIINLTCGTKILSIACFILFEKFQHKKIYVNTERNEIIEYLPGGITNYYPIKVQLSPSTYIQLQGQKVKKIGNLKGNGTEILSLAEVLASEWKYFSDFVLRYASSKPLKQKIIMPSVVNKGNIAGSFIKFERDFTKIKLVLAGKEVYYSETIGTNLIEVFTGKWFETACYLKLKKLNIFDRIDMNIKIDWIDEKLKISYDKNEFDILAMKGVYPTLFECKSGNKITSEITSDITEKLLSLKQKYLGRYSSVFLLTNVIPKDSVIEKLNDSDIKCILYKDIEKKFSGYDFKIPNLK